MKFYIEVIRAEAATSRIIHRTTVEGISPHLAKAKAALLDLYAACGANKARVLNDKDKELFVL